MKKIKKLINDLGLNYRKEITILIIVEVFILLLFSIGFIFLKNITLLVYGLLAMICFVFYYLYRYKIKLEQKRNKEVNDFINTFSFFRMYIANGENIYSSFKNVSEFATLEIKEYIDILLENINNDKSIKPYIDFACNFNNKLVEDVMISIFQMVENGNNQSYIEQFNNVFMNFKKRIEKESAIKRNNKFDRFISCSIIGSGVLMMVLVYGIINLVGEIIWVTN